MTSVLTYPEENWKPFEITYDELSIAFSACLYEVCGRVIEISFLSAIYAAFLETKTGNLRSDAIFYFSNRKITDETEFDFRSNNLVLTKKMLKSDPVKSVLLQKMFCNQNF